MSDNPFDQLGLKKELVIFLHEHHQLDDFLKSYVRLVQTKVHTDRGGNAELSTLVNSAYTFIKEEPDKIGSWLATMQNGHNEYKEMLEALVPEMERIQKENEELRTKYAETVASRAGSVDATVRSAPTSASIPKVKTPPRVDPTPSSVRTPPRVDPAPDVRTPPRATATPSSPDDPLIAGKYILMPQTSTYALGVDALRKKGAKRPFTFKENIQARVEAYESGDHRLFETWLDSCTGIAYKAGTTKFKIVPNCEQLRNIPKDFSQAFMPINYAKIDGIELDSGSTLFGKRAIYNTRLTKAQIVEHPAWLATVEDDKALLKTYTDIVFAAYASRYSASDKLMCFWVRQDTSTDELRAAFVHNLSNNSYASGSINLNNGGRFLLGK